MFYDTAAAAVLVLYLIRVLFCKLFGAKKRSSGVGVLELSTAAAVVATSGVQSISAVTECSST